MGGACCVNVTIGISEMKVSNRAEDILVTYSLGSCVGVAIYDPVACVGGMVHCMLPLSKSDLPKAKQKPAMFTDTGVHTLIQTALDMGAQKQRLIVKVAGAAKLMDEQGTFRIGERNLTVLRKVLWKNNFLIAAEEVGGTIARTLYLYMDTGRTVIRSQGQEREL
jgi:chemotaxis protein CheD